MRRAHTSLELRPLPSRCPRSSLSPPGDLHRSCLYRRACSERTHECLVSLFRGDRVASKGYLSRLYGWNAGDRLRRLQPGVNHHGHHSVTDDESRGGRHSHCTRRRSTRLLWRTRTGRYERLLRTRCRGEVRRRHGMRCGSAAATPGPRSRCVAGDAVRCDRLSRCVRSGRTVDGLAPRKDSPW